MYKLVYPCNVIISDFNEFLLQPSIPAKTWSGVYDATEDRSTCIQIPDGETETEESEDCLFINVYTPKVDKNTSYI